MMNRENVLRELLAEYETQRALNRREEIRRREEVARRSQAAGSTSAWAAGRGAPWRRWGCIRR